MKLNLARTQHRFLGIGIGLLPLMRYFAAPGFASLGILVVFLVAVCCVAWYRPKGMNRGLFHYVVYMALTYVFFTITSGKLTGFGTFVYNVLIYAAIIPALKGKSGVFYYLRKTIQTVSLIAAGVIIIQYAAHYLLGSFFQVFPTAWYTSDIRNSYSEMVRITTGTASGVFRPGSLFNEPSHFAAYCGVGTVLYIFDFLNTHRQRSIAIAALLTLTMFMSTSGTAYLLIAAIWSFFIIRGVFYKNNYVRLLSLLMIGALIIGSIILSNFSFFSFAIGRFAGGMNSSMATNRMGGYSIFAESGIWTWLFGVGIGREELNSVFSTMGAVMLIRLGLVGVALYLYPLVRNYMRFKAKRILIIVIVLIAVTADIHDFSNLCFYSVLVFANETDSGKGKVPQNAHGGSEGGNRIVQGKKSS